MAHKNDYSVIAFLSTGEAKKWNFVHNLKEFSKFLDDKHPQWLYFNVYDRREGTYLKRFYRGKFVPDFLLFFLTFSFTFNITFNGFINSPIFQTF